MSGAVEGIGRIGQRTEDRGQKTEEVKVKGKNRGQRSEVRGQKSEVRRQRPEAGFTIAARPGAIVSVKMSGRRIYYKSIK
jgi:hypothetical protein